MRQEGRIQVTQGDLRRLKVIEQIVEKKFGQRRAAELLERSVRQVIRLVKRFREEGLKGLIHRLRGKRSNRKHSEDFEQRVIKIYRKDYEGFGPTLAQEKLAERNKIQIGRETLRQLLIREKLWEVSRKGSKHRQWRERRACFGEMTQVDGSHHDWLEGRGPKLVLMGYIDDATNEVFAWFYDYEGTLPAMDSFYRYSKKYGLPYSIYIDRLNAYRGHGKLSLEEELAGGTRKKSQFERALEELGVKVIHAQSPQAKGRIERLFKTFQDRLVKEMRLARVKTKDEANRFLASYLPKYNRRFSVKAREESDLHRCAPGGKKLKQVLSVQTEHLLRNDNTIRHENKCYQILTHWNGYRPKQVMMEERINEALYVMDGDRELRYREVVEPSRKFHPKKTARKLRKPWHPPVHHPWRVPLRAGMVQRAA